MADDPTPTPEDRRRATILARGVSTDPEVVDLFARGIAVARTGGDVRAFLQREVEKGARRG